MKTALITGASGGIGEELARVHAKTNGNLVLIARSTSKLEQLKNELESQNSIKVWILSLDLSLPNAAQQVMDFVLENNIEVDYLINNAGFGDYGFFHESNWEKQRKMIELNITTLTHLCHLFIPKMINRKSGRIMNVASVASFQPGPLMSVYYATKAYVLSFSEALHNEISSYGISVTALCPGPVKTGFQEAAQLSDSKLFKQFKPADPYKVAQYGYKALLKGKSVAVDGLVFKIMVFLLRFTPRNQVVKLVRSFQDNKQKGKLTKA